LPGQTTFDRVIVMAVAALLGAFALWPSNSKSNTSG